MQIKAATANMYTYFAKTVAYFCLCFPTYKDILNLNVLLLEILNKIGLHNSVQRFHF